MMESALSATTAHVHVWSSWVLVISGLTHCIKLASANAGLGTNSSLYNKSAAGPMNITDFCPGVEYLINQNNPNNTFLQANVSDCENYGLYPTARQGVLYGVCADLTTFCVLRLDFPEGTHTDCPEESSYLAWFKDSDTKHWLYLNLDGAGYFTQQGMATDNSCPNSHYRCQAESLYCLPVYTRCNGFADCIHGEDEQDYLRKQARQLENEIDLKLVSFSKLGTSYSLHKDDADHDSASNSGTKEQTSDTAPLLNRSSSEHMCDTIALEIEQLLSKLTKVNEGMVEYTQNISHSSPSAALLHMLQRHRDILQDYTHEFQKTKANITALREREDLLGSVRREINTYKSSTGLNRRTDLYLKENDHIRNIAIATKENMSTQNKVLGSITQRVNTLANRFPVINSLVQRINVKKRRDSIVLGCVIAVCLVLLILYALH
ncbi:hypothetical protein ACOMHN_059871 [Nucella lapillus]